MLAIRNKKTLKIPYLFDGDTKIIITDKVMEKPLRVLDVSTSTHEVIIVSRNDNFASNKFTYDNGWIYVNPADALTDIADKNRSDCESQILSVYPDKIQRSAALGVYPQSYIDTMSDYIVRCIAEENRVFDLLEAATTVTEIMAVEKPAYPKV